MNKYNQLREEIIKCCPDIMDLKFGCEMFYKGAMENLNVKNGKYTIVDNDDGYINAICEEGGSFHCGTFDANEVGFKDIVEIIGRDITLEDLFLTFLSLGFHYELGEIGIAGMPKSGLCMIDIEKNRKVIGIISWELNKPLQDQSDECKELLWDLIVKN